MNSLTYGTLPKFAEFANAVVNSDTGPRYSIKLSSADADMARKCGIAELSYVGNAYTAHQLYALCEALCEVYDRTAVERIGVPSEDESEWAGDFCSAIMTTLGFEWV